MKLTVTTMAAALATSMLASATVTLAPAAPATGRVLSTVISGETVEFRGHDDERVYRLARGGGGSSDSSEGRQTKHNCFKLKSPSCKSPKWDRVFKSCVCEGRVMPGN